MRAVVLTLVAACGFSNSADLDASTTSDGMRSIDGMVVPPPAPVVRLVEITDASVVGGPHTDFPVAVTATIAAAHSMGFDVWFSADAAGLTKLAHEIERYDNSTGELLAWVKIPLLSSATTFYLHYGDMSITANQATPQAVWTAYSAVWHLSTATDSTALNNGTASGATPAGGKLAGAFSFDGTSNVINAGSGNSIDNLFAGGGSAEAWFVATTWGGGGFGRIFDKGPSNTVFSMCDDDVANALLFGKTFSSGAGNWCTPQNSLALGAWTHVAVIYDSGSTGNVPAMYIDGVAQTVSTRDSPSGTSSSDASASLAIGDRTSGGRAFDGRLDELRLATNARSAGWIITSYENQRDPAAFAVVAPP